MPNSQPLYTDNDLFALILQDDRRGLELLFKRYYEPLYRFAYLMVKREDAADDLVQEAFFKLWEIKDTIARDVAIKPYLYKAVKNRALNYLEKEKRRETVHEYPEGLQDEGKDTISGIQSEELEKLIGQAIESLPEKCRLVFKMSRFEEMSYKEIAQNLDLSVKTVENQMGTALKKLKKYLEPYLHHRMVWLFLLIAEGLL